MLFCEQFFLENSSCSRYVDYLIIWNHMINVFMLAEFYKPETNEQTFIILLSDENTINELCKTYRME